MVVHGVIPYDVAIAGLFPSYDVCEKRTVVVPERFSNVSILCFIVGHCQIQGVYNIAIAEEIVVVGSLYRAVFKL